MLDIEINPVPSFSISKVESARPAPGSWRNAKGVLSVNREGE
jgi:hypothetical protein